MGQSRARQLIVVLITVAFGLPALFLTMAHIAGSSDGARIFTTEPAWTDSGVEIISIDPNGPFRDGDIVLAVDDIPIETFADNLLHPTRWLDIPGVNEAFVYTVDRKGEVLDIDVTTSRYSLWDLVRREWVAFVVTGALLALGVLVVWKAGQDSASLALFSIGAGSFFSNAAWATVQVSDILAGWPYVLAFWLLYFGFPLMLAGTLHFCLTFPRPLPFVTTRTWIIPGVYVATYLFAAIWLGAAAAQAEGSIDVLQVFEEMWAIPSVVLLGGGLVALLRNWRISQDPISRKKVRWILFAFGLIVTMRLVLWNIAREVTGEPLIDWDKFNIFVLIIPIAIAIAILRHNLFDIDLIISRAMLWGTLTALVIAAYAGIVAFIGATLNPGGTFGPSVIAVGIVAVLFQPVRARVQRVVNRIVYGDRDDPYAAVSRLGQRLESAIAPGSVLPTITETVAQALKVPYAAIVLDGAGGRLPGTTYGSPSGEILSLPLTYQSDRIGELRISARGEGEQFSRADRRLIDDLVRQIGVAAHAVRVTEELQHSREQIVTAREEERRRLRRDLHDGIGPSLASAVLKLGAARNRLRSDPTTVDAMLDELTAQVQDTISDIRRVAYDLRPPALDELGLVGALEEYAARVESAGFGVQVTESGNLADLPAAVEVAAYRIAIEGIANAVRHSGGSQCSVELRAGEQLRVTVSDNGRGMNQSTRPGIGLTAMRERAEELGGSFEITRSSGGVTIAAVLPVRTDD